MEAHTTNAAGDDLSRAITTLLAAGVRTNERAGRQPSLRGPAAASPVAVVRERFEVEQVTRYAAVSGDRNPIHTDNEVARSAGLPGRIVHGMCVLAAVCDSAVGEFGSGDGSAVGRLSARFAEPILPGDAMTTEFWIIDAGEYGFRSLTERGPAIKHGSVTIR
jgi:acyl dehydratase